VRRVQGDGLEEAARREEIERRVRELEREVGALRSRIDELERKAPQS
jgi:uncharacterized protein YceH (UPF0502 family)